MKLLVILPAFNEAKVISDVLDSLKKELKKINLKSEIVLIDDGSGDSTGQIAQSKGIRVLRHVINRGLGSALKTGLEYARINNFNLALTFDADGQHHPRDIEKVLIPLINKKADVVIGVREIKKMPFDRQIMTFFSRWLTLFLFGVYCRDTQSGFRALNKETLQKIKIRTQRMEVSSEFFKEIKDKELRLKEVPIRVIYTPYSRVKGQSNLNAFKVLIKLILRLGR